MAVASSLPCFRTTVGERMILPSTVMWGKRLKLWKTMPTSSRMWRISALTSVTLSPSMEIEPESRRSRRLTERRRVLFPEPEGPMMSTTSPFRTLKSTPRRAWISPLKVFTAAFISMYVSTMPQLFFHDSDETREKERHHEVDEGDDGVALEIPERSGCIFASAPQKVGHGEYGDEG